ncbi:MAG TPA: hypothetical protein VFR67_21380 [Pilimelia sp.]|nr:hypothetical protein [Pilimelia sp.]
MTPSRAASTGTKPAEPHVDSALHTGPFHVALRAAIRDRGLTLDRLRWHLARRGISVALSSLSNWQHGHSRPEHPNSVRAVGALEDILRLPPTSLVRLLMTGDPLAEAAADRGVARRRAGLDEAGGALAELLDALPGSRECQFDVLSRQDKVSVDTDRRGSQIWSRTVVRARSDGVDRYVLRYFGCRNGDMAQVRLHSLENCRLGRVRRHPSAPVLVAELLFDELLRAGDTWVFEESVYDPTGDPQTDHAFGFRHPVGSFALMVRFHPAALPVDCHAYAQLGLYDPRQRTADLTLNAHHAVHLVASNVTAGVLGVGWRWPD